MPSERPLKPHDALRRALLKVQLENIKMLQANSPNEGRGNSIERMAEILDEESGYSELYKALEQFVDHFGDPFKTARAALAKANPKEEKQNG